MTEDLTLAAGVPERCVVNDLGGIVACRRGSNTGNLF